jgi:hypothetical protein
MNDDLSLIILSVIKRRLPFSFQFRGISSEFNNKKVEEGEGEEKEEELFVGIDGSFSIYSSS